MAPKAPEVVLSVALEIPETRNVRVHEDLADAALAMPPDLASQWVQKEIQWLKEQDRLFSRLPEKLGALISHIARGGQAEVAIELAEVLLDVRPDPKTQEKAEQGEIMRMLLEPRPLFDIWDYEQVLEKNVPDLAEAIPDKALKVLCGLLEKAIRLSECEPRKGEAEDYSHIWRPAIEEHDQNRAGGLRDVLVSGVRDAGEKLIGSEGKRVLDIIERRPYRIFARIGLHLRRKEPDVDIEGTSRLVTDPEVFDSLPLHHELYWLLQDCFERLPREARETYFSLVEQGPDSHKYRCLPVEEAKDREQAERFIRHWTYMKLHPVRAHLPETWRERLRELNEEFGEPEHPDFHGVVSTEWIQPASPKKIEELRQMDFVGIVDFLKTWEPSGEFEEPSLEGMGRELSRLVSEAPERFAPHAELFEGLDPAYIRELISTLGEAVKVGKRFEWEPVLNLCKWVVDQPRRIPERKASDPMIDPDWGWTRKAIAELLSAGFEKGEAQAGLTLREKAWEVLEPLTEDEQPTLEYEEEYGGSNMEPASLSINTVRGAAMHAVVRHALWLRRYFEEAEEQDRIGRGFKEMPEVRRVLDRHLDTKVDRTLTVRAVYGQWFPWLVLMDTEWAARNVPTVFPRDEQHRRLRNAAWDTYVSMSRPYDNVFEVLRDEYAFAVDLVGSGDRMGPFHRHPDECLGTHLVTFYWRGKLNLEEKGLVHRFFAKAPPELRGLILENIGRSLRQTEGNVPEEIIERLKRLWQWRLESIRTGGADAARELIYFGWWFISGKLEDEWAITQLGIALELAGRIDAIPWVLERLQALAPQYTAMAVECVKLMAEGEREGWVDRVGSNLEHAREILRIGLESEDPRVRDATEDIVHRLGAHGYLSLRALLGDRTQRSGPGDG
jgi:hypothetical protein